MSDATMPMPSGDGGALKSPRGFFDAALCAVLLYGVYAATPLGAVVETGVRAALGHEERPSLFASFRGRDTDIELDTLHAGKFDTTALKATKDAPQSVTAAATRTGIDKELLLALLALEGRCDAGACEVKRMPFLDFLGDINTSGTHVPIGIVADVLKKGAVKFDGDAETALEALYIPPFVVERAVRQASTSGIEDASFIESHAEFFPAPTRRGVMQTVVHILALYRLRTLSWPTPAKARVTSPFGYRTHPVLKTRRFHNGTDIGVRTGTPLRSAHRGTVKRAGEDAVSGQYVHVNHGFGIVSTYCHMSQLDVKADQRVGRQQTLGLSGATGRVTGPHLHYILRLDKKAVDPQAYGEAPNRTRPLDMNGKAGGVQAPKALRGVLKKRAKRDAGPDNGDSDATAKPPPPTGRPPDDAPAPKP